MRFRAVTLLLALLISACVQGETSVTTSSARTTGPSSVTGGSGTGPSGTTSDTSPPPAVAASPERYYDCPTLLSDGEVQQATGLGDAALLEGAQSEEANGQTYCQFFGGEASIAISVFTDGSKEQVFEPLVALAASFPSIPGVGDEARWAEQLGFLFARVGGTGVTIALSDFSGALPASIADPEQAAVTMAKLVVSRL